MTSRVLGENVSPTKKGEIEIGLTENPHSKRVDFERGIILEGYTSSRDIVGGLDRSLPSIRENILVVNAGQREKSDLANGDERGRGRTC